MACFTLTFVYPSNKRVIYRLKRKSLKPCIKKFVSVSTLYLKSFEKKNISDIFEKFAQIERTAFFLGFP